MTWDQFFVLMAQTASKKSKDPSTKVGAVVVDDDNIVRATGFNGFPRGVADLARDYDNREVKYKKVLHAEENALLAAARVGVALKGCRLFCSMHPCYQCAKRIIQCGIVAVRYPMPNQDSFAAYQRWSEDMKESALLMHEAGVQCLAVEMRDVTLEG
jgi:dCMP deaminase